jgi:hypothetical protein
MILHVGPNINTNNASSRNTRMFKSDNNLIPFIKPDIAERINAPTKQTVIMSSIKLDSIPKRLLMPPDKVRIPAPKEADIPATKAYKQIPSMPMPSHFAFPEAIKG